MWTMLRGSKGESEARERADFSPGSEWRARPEDRHETPL